MANNGNCAAMREALEYVKERIGSWWEYLEVSEKVESALAAPPRNCDVGTPQEQADRFNKFCESHPYSMDGVGSRCNNCELDGCDCEIAWSQMPYEAEGKEASDG